MSPIPLHIQRRLEQRWASRFASIAPNASKEKPAGVESGGSCVILIRIVVAIPVTSLRRQKRTTIKWTLHYTV
jgi:hypothetical protein